MYCRKKKEKKRERERKKRKGCETRMIQSIMGSAYRKKLFARGRRNGCNAIMNDEKEIGI